MQATTLVSRRRNVEDCCGKRTEWTTWPVKYGCVESHHALDGADLGCIMSIFSYKQYCHTGKDTFLVIDYTKMTGDKQLCLFCQNWFN